MSRWVVFILEMRTQPLSIRCLRASFCEQHIGPRAIQTATKYWSFTLSLAPKDLNGPMRQQWKGACQPPVQMTVSHSTWGTDLVAQANATPGIWLRLCSSSHAIRLNNCCHYRFDSHIEILCHKLVNKLVNKLDQAASWKATWSCFACKEKLTAVGGKP